MVTRTVAAVPREWLDLAAPLLSEEELMSFIQVTEREKDESIRPSGSAGRSKAHRRLAPVAARVVA